MSVIKEFEARSNRFPLKTEKCRRPISDLKSKSTTILSKKLTVQDNVRKIASTL